VDKLDPKSTKFIEFGVENFHESNCRFVMQNRNWKGFVIDSSKERIAELAKRQYYWMHHLVSTAAFVTSSRRPEPPTAGLIGDLVTSRSNVPRSCDIQSRKCLVSPRRSAFT
jgi:hypothetical protein